MGVRLESSWKEALKADLESEYFSALTRFIRSEYYTERIFPAGKEIFKAFDLCSLRDTRVVIIGQDPYHGYGQANGLCFAVNRGVLLPPSLKNILKEVADSTGKPLSNDGDLTRWAKQGVLLLNAILTVRDSEPGSHSGCGWGNFTNSAISILNLQKSNLVFLLWGSFAQAKAAFIDESKHLVLKTSHPSPLSAHRGFLGCGHFAKANYYLTSHGMEPINW